jgi:hypothetical protein
LVEATFSDPAVVEVALHAQPLLGCGAMSARLLLLPLRDEFHATSRVFGVVVTNGMPSLRARRFLLSPDPIVRFEKVRPTATNVRLVARASDVPSPAPCSVLKNPPQALRLVVDNA